MQNVKLVIASKTRSSWSLRPWLFLKHHGVRFDEILIPLGQSDTRKRILEHSPSGKLPCLRHGGIRVWESLAICEYAAETFALPRAWPIDPAARAMARSMATEMHAGFAELRRELPFDTQRPPMPQAVGEEAQAEIRRIRSLWRQARSRHGEGGPWLFGQFGIVDAMFAPVALRFHQYQVALEGPEREYMFNVLMHPAIQSWLDDSGGDIHEPEFEGERTAELTHLPMRRGAATEIVEPRPAPVARPAPDAVVAPEEPLADAAEQAAAEPVEEEVEDVAVAAAEDDALAVTVRGEPAEEPEPEAVAEEEPLRYDDDFGEFGEVNPPGETLPAPLAALLEIPGAAPLMRPQAPAPAEDELPEAAGPALPMPATPAPKKRDEETPGKLRSTILPP